jgi:hypothetical protein
MSSIVHGRPAKFERLTYVESLLYYNGDVLAQYVLDGDHWLVLWAGSGDLGTHYTDRHIYFSVLDDVLKKYFANNITLRDVMARSAEMWTVDAKWERLPNGHGVPDTDVSLWSSTKWELISEDERPTDKSYHSKDD